MFETGKTNPVARKAFEIAYAFFRLSARMPDEHFAASIRGEATRLMAGAAKEDHEATAKSAVAIEYFLKLAAEVDLINFSNTEVLLKEIGNLRALMDATPLAEPFPIQEVSIANIFSHVSIDREQELFKEKPIVVKTEPKEKFVFEGVSPEPSQVDIHGDNHNQTSGEVRQAAILQRIRQSGNCRIRDIQEILPDCSERTIRYDLQSLMEKNLVERIGNGGPAVFYRIRQAIRQ